jgi:hypothetical protein
MKTAACCLQYFMRRQRTVATRCLAARLRKSVQLISSIQTFERSNVFRLSRCKHTRSSCVSHSQGRPRKSQPSISDVLLLLLLQAWQKRYLVLRDAWTPDGDTILELHDSDPASPTTSLASVISSASFDDLSSVGVSRRMAGSRRHYIINLRTVIYVDVYHDSKSFPNAFIVFR